MKIYICLLAALLIHTSGLAQSTSDVFLTDTLFPRTDPKDVGLIYRMLKVVDTLFTEHEIPYWIDAGTALGAERHHGFIPWNDDADLGFFKQDAHKILALEDAFASYGFHLVEQPNLIRLYPSKEKLFPYVDICAFSLHNNEVFHLDFEMARNAFPNGYYLPREVSKFKRVKFGPIELNAIPDMNRYLTTMYGEDVLTKAIYQSHNGNEIIEKKVNIIDFTPAIYTTDDSSIPPYHKKAITPNFNPNRLGDNFLEFILAKWLAYKYKTSFLYRPFPYSDQLVLHTVEPSLTDSIENSFDKVVDLQGDELPSFQNEESTLFVTGYFRQWISVKTFDQPNFRNMIRNLIKPISPVSEYLPKDRLTLAVHVRKGGSFDSQEVINQWPLKFPPDTFYIEQIKKIYRHFNKQPVFVHIFTDDPNPKAIADDFKKKMGKRNITFSYRQESNNHFSNVLEDLFYMTKFDCLIRPASSFSWSASYLGDFKVVISPTNYSRTGDEVKITEVDMEVKNID